MTEYVSVTEDTPMARTGAIKLHGPEGFEGMRKAGRLAAEILDELTGFVQPGVTTGEIDDKAIEKSFTAEDRAKLDKMKDWEKEARTQRLRPTVAPPSRPFVSPYHRAGVPSGSVRDPQSGS